MNSNLLYNLLESFLLENNFYSEFYTYLAETWKITPKMLIDEFEFPITEIYSRLKCCSFLGDKWLQYIWKYESGRSL